MKMSYKNLSVAELENSLKSLLPNASEFDVQFSLFRDAPSIVHDEVMSLENILKLAKKQGFRVNDICGVHSGDLMKECIGIALNKPFIDENTNESIEGVFVSGDIAEWWSDNK